MNSNNKTSDYNIANAYHTKDGGIIIPLDQFAREALDEGPETVDRHVKVDQGSILIFRRQLPKNLSISDNSKVNLDANAFIENAAIKNSNVTIKGSGIVNMENVNIDHSKLDMIATENSDIINYNINGSLLKNNINLESEKHNSCSHVYGDNLQALDSNLDGGVYSDTTIIDSNIDQPGSTLFYNSYIRKSSIINHEQTNKHWTALRHDPKHQIEESSIKNSLIMNDRHHHFYVNGCDFKDTISINGLIGELSQVSGPKQKIILNNLDITGDKLDYTRNKSSALVGGSNRLNPHVHDNDIYYTELPQNRTFTPTKHDRHFKNIRMNSALLNDIDHFATETNSTKDNQAKIVKIDDAINHELDTQSSKAISQDDSLSL